MRYCNIVGVSTRNGSSDADGELTQAAGFEKKQTRDDGRPRDVFLVPSKSSLSEYEEDFVSELLADDLDAMENLAQGSFAKSDRVQRER